jgi:hypothetical protein
MHREGLQKDIENYIMRNLIILPGDEIMEDELIWMCSKHRETDKHIQRFDPKRNSRYILLWRILLKHIVNKRLCGSGLDISTSCEHDIVLFGSIKTGNFVTSFTFWTLFRATNLLVTKEMNQKND